MPPSPPSAGEAPTDWLLGRRAAPERPEPLALAIDAWKRAQAAAGQENWADAEFWAERALRLGPNDTQVRFLLGMALLRQGKPHCFRVFQDLVLLSDTLPAHRGLISAATLSQSPGEVGRLIGGLLSRFARPQDQEFPRLAADVARRLDLPGWCAANQRGEVTVMAEAAPRFLLDGRPVRCRLTRSGLYQLPAAWAAAQHLAVLVGDRPLLGSPIDLARHRLVEGFVAAEGAELAGWAWHPANPDAPVLLRIESAAGKRLAAPLLTAGAAQYPDQDRLTAPQAFRLSTTALETCDGLVHLRDASGRDLTGSPLLPDPWAQSARAVVLQQAGSRAPLPRHALLPLWADGPPPERPAPRGAARKRPGLAVVLPVYRGLETTLLCLGRVLASVPRGTRIIVVDDASPEPALSAALDNLARKGRIQVIRNAANLGFPGSVNRGMAAAGDRDLVLLNSDALVPPGWLERLREAAYAAPDIGTVAPLSNDATILSYPDIREPQPPPSTARAIDRIDALARKANGAAVLDIPTSVGFCMYIRAACRAETGPFREDVFAQGYGEENDFCMRARHLGWRHVVAPGIFVAHIGGQSFRAARAHLLRRNQAILERMHPGYGALIAAHIAADPLAEARRRLDRARWHATRGRSAERASALLITHAEGGGVERQLRQRAQALARQGLTPIILRPVEGEACQVARGLPQGDPWAEEFPNLTFRLPEELRALAAFLRAEKPQHIELHHRLGHAHALLGLAPLLGIPLDIVVHDYAAICPRVTLVTVTKRYCGEPDAEQCRACVADLGSRLREEITVPALRARTAADFAAARSVTFPSKEVESRFRRYVPALSSRITPWETDPAQLPRRLRSSPRDPRKPVRVAIIGAIGTEKGYDVILDCARDAARRALPLEFVIIGYTHDDARLIDTGRVRITYRFAPAEAVAEIAAQQADFAFIPSIWPETWCFALSDAWGAGLRAAVFDIGTQAERVRRTGHGWVLPLALPTAGINNALISLMQTVN